MPFVPAANVVRLAITYSDTGGNEAVNVLHFQYLDPPIPGVAPINNLVTEVEDWLNSAWAAIASNQWTAINIEARDLTSEFSYFVTTPISAEGTGTGDALPPQDTIAVSLRSVFGGRSRRGRLFHVGLTEGGQSGGYITEITRTAVIGCYEALLASAFAADWQWGVLSYTENGVPRVTPLFTAYTSVTVTDLVVDSMDKRKPS